LDAPALDSDFPCFLLDKSSMPFFLKHNYRSCVL
jgi:hypothetical protein